MILNIMVKLRLQVSYLDIKSNSICLITAARPAYAGTEGCYEMLVFFYFFLFNA